MRKLLTATLAAAFMMMIAIPAMAQQGEMKLGGLVAYGSEVKQPGFGVKFNYGITDQIRLAPAFTYFLPKKEEISLYTYSAEYKYNFWLLDVDGNYLFLNDGFELYGIAGLNVTGISFSSTISGDLPMYKSDDLDLDMDESASDTNFGLNIGAGIQYPVSDNMFILGEAKYVLSSADQLVVSAGLMFKL
ncbi:MAG: Ail/Lom family outer membrane beta-barrel protein [Bacteroidales bacterium]|nr:Ail/Lom family outer membrane beta-barrel protein [Bacteroidales bacterium]